MLADVPSAPKVLVSWQQALRLVRAQSTTLAQDEARIQQAQGLSRQALGAALPTLTAQGNVTHHLITGTGFNLTTATQDTTIPDPATTWNASLSLRAPLFAPKAWYDHKTSKLAIDTLRLQKKESERVVLAAVADTIVSVVTAERLAEVSRVSLRSALSTLDLNRRRAQLGAASAVDVLRAEQEVSLSRAQVVAADEGVRKAREALGLALGTTQAWGVTPDIRLDALADEAKTSCRQEPSVQARSDIKAQDANLRVLERRVNSVDRTFWPTVDAVSTFTLYSSEVFTNNKRFTWTIGGVLTWQLYDGGVRYGARTSAEGELNVARYQRTDSIRRAEMEVKQAIRAIDVAKANLKVSERAREIAAESARLSKIAFVNGSGTSFDLVDTARRLREAELDLAIKEFELVRAKITAFLALASCSV